MVIKKFYNKFCVPAICIILVVVLSMMTLNGCTFGSKDKDSPHGTGQESTNPEIPNNNIEKDDGLKPDDPIIDDLEKLFNSEIDIESLVYGQIAKDLQTEYDVFVASATLKSGNKVYGLGFTDYSDAYTEENSERILFECGFAAFKDETIITTAEREKGIEITNLNAENDKYAFIFANLNQLSSHFVAYDTYICYDINANGEISYTESKYIYGQCDAARGALWSYDEGKWLWFPPEDLGNYFTITGDSLASIIDYDAIVAEMDKILAEQDYNGVEVDIVTAINVAVEALQAYLLHTQEETILGYRVADLLEFAKDLDPSEYYYITDEGIVVTEFPPDPPPTPSGLCKWLTGIVCGIAVIGGLALSVFIPALAPIGGMIIGAAVEGFMQVVVNNTTLENLNWVKIAIAGVAGAISANLGIFGDAVVGGITNVIFAGMDGVSDPQQLLTSFAWGFGAGIVLGASFKIAAKGIGAFAKKFMSKTVAKISGFLDDHLVRFGQKTLNKLDDIIPESSLYNATKAADAESFINLQLFANKADDLLPENFQGIIKAISNLTDDLPNIKPQQYLEELAKSGVKFTPENVLVVGKTQSGKLVWLETGTGDAGFQHIINRHADDFLKKGIRVNEIPAVIAKALSDGVEIRLQIYEVIYNGKLQRILIGDSINGYIVTAYPQP